jgi:hypothetical protein
MFSTICLNSSTSSNGDAVDVSPPVVGGTWPFGDVGIIGWKVYGSLVSNDIAESCRILSPELVTGAPDFPEL